MKAAICTKYGTPEMLQIKEVSKPTPRNNQVRIKVYAAGVTASDIFIRSSNMPLRYKIPMRIMMGIIRPRKPILGLVFSGKIDAVGKDTGQFNVGDEVYGLTGFSMGAYAEYVCLKEQNSTLGCMALKPGKINHEEATAAAYGGLLAIQYLNKDKIAPGDHVCIYGASGTSGTIAIQLAKNYGAKVTAICSTKNIDMVKQLGADAVIDYTQTTSIPANENFDYILDAAGRLKSSTLKENCKKALKSTGTYISIDDGDLKLSSPRLEAIKELVETNIIKPVMDRTYPLSDIAKAHEYVEKGHKKGGVAITIAI